MLSNLDEYLISCHQKDTLNSFGFKGKAHTNQSLHNRINTKSIDEIDKHTLNYNDTNKHKNEQHSSKNKVNQQTLYQRIQR